MKISEECVACLYDKQAHLTDNKEYLAEIRTILENRADGESAPYLVYRFNQVYGRYFGKRPGYQKQKKTFNDLALFMEADIRHQIEASPDPLKTALFFSRAGNYIDFGAMNHVETDTFLSMLRNIETSENDEKTYASFLSACSEAKNFLLLADNCGEIVFDKLMLEQLHRVFPQLTVTVMVRAGEALNDVTLEDAAYVGIDKVAEIITNGVPVAGTVYDLLTEDSRKVVDGSDVILSKGQGNFETFSPQGIHAFYLLLCKCDLFTRRFRVPRLSGIFLEE